MRVGYFYPGAATVVWWLLLGNGAYAQRTSPGELRFVARQLLAASENPLAAKANAGDHPVEIPSFSYNLDYAKQALVPVMPKSVAISQSKNGDVDLFIPGIDNPHLQLHGDRLNVHNSKGPDWQTLSRQTLGAAFSDYDHSGHESLFVAGTECVKLYHNNGKSFEDVTRKAGLQLSLGLLCAGVTIGDLDGDGFPDLLVAAYTDLEHPPANPTITFPNDFPGVESRLFRNNRDGTFTDVTESAGVGKNPGRTRKAIFADFNNDQRLDILLLRDQKPPALFLNRGEWKFEDKTWDAGEDLTTHAFFEGTTADFNHDGKTDLALWATHSFRILLNQGNGVFKRTLEPRMPEPSISLFGFRGIVADLDHNGFDDIVTVDQNGTLHLFTNTAGVFEESSLVLPPEHRQSYLRAMKFNDLPVRFLSRKPDGTTVLLSPEARQTH